jgi:hypothetical protein
VSASTFSTTAIHDAYAAAARDEVASDVHHAALDRIASGMLIALKVTARTVHTADQTARVARRVAAMQLAAEHDLSLYDAIERFLDRAQRYLAGAPVASVDPALPA